MVCSVHPLRDPGFGVKVCRFFGDIVQGAAIVQERSINENQGSLLKEIEIGPETLSY